MYQNIKASLSFFNKGFDYFKKMILDLLSWTTNNENLVYRNIFC
jgi:hypothetical protein